jgi:hypothetical protein
MVANMKWFKRKAARPPQTWAGPVSFVDWTEDDISAISAAIRKRNGQPEQPGFRIFARVALNTMRGGAAVELVARAMEESANPGSDPDAPIDGRTGHYMAGMPRWCMWVEYARPAVEAIAGRAALANGECGGAT